VFIDHIRELADRHPGREALVTAGSRLTYGALIGIVDAKARALQQALPGEGRGVVGLSVRDEVENLIATLALLAAGRRLMTLATFDPLEARQKLAAAAGIEIVLTDGPDVSLPGIPHLLWSGIDDAQRGRAPKVGSLLLKTSGSTGDSKLIEFDEHQLAVQLRDVLQYDRLRYFRLASVEHNICQRQRLLCLFGGGTNVFRTPGEVDLAKVRATLRFDIIELSLMNAEDLIRRDDRSTFAGIAIRMTGSPVPYRMRQQIQERVSRELYVRYGTSESGTVSMAGPDDHDADEVTGRLSPGAEVEILDEGGKPVAAGSNGTIRIRSRGMATGYLNAPAESAKRFVDGWFVPGDIGRFRADGQLIVSGRSDDMMMLNGLNIFPQEIESVLERHPAVRAAAALSLDSQVHGQIPVAAVQLEAGASIDPLDLQAYAREQLGLRTPRRILILPSLPRASDGKLHRRALLASFRPGA
jgi:long-chain acyl-CoA synthetase